METGTEAGTEDSYLKYYRKTKRHKYSEEQALQIREQRLLLDEENVIHGYIKLASLKKICKERGVSITKYLTACLIYSIYQEYAAGAPMKDPIGISRRLTCGLFLILPLWQISLLCAVLSIFPEENRQILMKF